jgi:hypothetical protein
MKIKSAANAATNAITAKVIEVRNVSIRGRTLSRVSIFTVQFAPSKVTANIPSEREAMQNRLILANFE